MSKTKFTQADDAFRKLLKELRMAKNFSQVELAARLGMPQSYVSKYETGERRLDFVETVLLCEALGIGIQNFAKAFCSKLVELRRVQAKRLKQ
jgi:transcriptional regulator with XRE-family HTH domain